MLKLQSPSLRLGYGTAMQKNVHSGFAEGLVNNREQVYSIFARREYSTYAACICYVHLILCILIKGGGIRYEFCVTTDIVLRDMVK